MALSAKTKQSAMMTRQLIVITILFSMVSFAWQEQQFINIVLKPRDWQDPTQADGFFCGIDKDLDSRRLLAEFNTDFIFQLIDKTQDTTPKYRTTVFDLVAFDNNEQPKYMLDQLPCNLEKEESGLFTVFMAPGTRQCNRQTFDDALHEKYGYHPLAVLVSSNLTDITERFVSKAETYKKFYKGILPKLCASGLMMNSETAESRQNELTRVFNFAFNEDRNVKTDVSKMCKTADDTLHSISKSSLFDINSDIKFKHDKQEVYEEDGFAKIVILRKSCTNQRALGFVTTDFPASGGQCSPASDNDIVPLYNFIVFNEGEEETEVIVRLKKDEEIEDTECFNVQARNVAEIQNNKRRKRGVTFSKGGSDPQSSSALSIKEKKEKKEADFDKLDLPNIMGLTGDSSRMTKRKSLGYGTIHMTAKSKVNQQDWTKTFMEMVESKEIKNSPETKILILSGSHGDLNGDTCFTQTDESYLSEDGYYVDVFTVMEYRKYVLTNQMIFDVVNMRHFFGLREKVLIGYINNFKPTVIISFYCHSSLETGDVQKALAKRTLYARDEWLDNLMIRMKNLENGETKPK